MSGKQKISYLGLLITVLIFVGVLGFLIKYGDFEAGDDSGLLISNQATADYCSENDAITDCNSQEKIFSGQSVSNRFETIIRTSISRAPTSAACFRMAVDHPDSVKKLLFIVRDQGQVIARTARPYTKEETISITDPTFTSLLAANREKDFTIIVKADQHLALRLTGNPVRDCLAATRQLAWGDLHGLTETGEYQVIGNNEIDASDITAAIRYRAEDRLQPKEVVEIIRKNIDGLRGDR